METNYPYVSLIRLHLRAHVEMSVGSDFVHGKRLYIARRIQHLRRPRALVQRNNLGFVPHTVVGPVELNLIEKEGTGQG